MSVLLYDDKVVVDDQNKKNRGGRPVKDKYDKQDKLCRIYLDTGEYAVANNLLVFHKLSDLSSLFHFLLREDAVRNRQALDQMMKELLTTVRNSESEQC